MQHTTASNTRYAWILVLGLGVVMAISFSITINAFSVLTLPLMETFGSTNEQAARIASVFMITMTLAMPASGWLLDHVEPRPVMAVGAVITGAGYLMAAHSSNIDVFTIGMALCGLGIGASTYIPSFTLITHWMPPQRQGLAFGVLLSITAIGGIIYPVVLTRMIATFGWRTSMEVGTTLIFCICLPILLFLVRLPPALANIGASGGTAVNEKSEGKSIAAGLRMPRYWLWIGMFLLITMSSLSILMGLVPYLRAVGYSANSASIVYASVSASSIVGNLLFGAISARWGAERTLLLGVSLGAAGLICLMMASHANFGMAAIIIFCIAWGTTFNLVNQLSPPLLMDFIGQRNFGSLLGIGNLVSGLGAAAGPSLFGYLVDTTHAYIVPLVLCTVLMLLALAPLLVLHRSPKLTIKPIMAHSI